MDREASAKEREQVQEQMSAAQTGIAQLKEEVAARQEVVRHVALPGWVGGGREEWGTGTGHDDTWSIG